MRATNVIIITSGQAHLARSGELDQTIASVRALKKQPILVLGPDGDELLSLCTRIEECEIVFDPNFDGDVFSSVKAGLEAVSTASFVIDLAIPNSMIGGTTWQLLEKELLEEHFEKTCDVLEPLVVSTAATPSVTQTDEAGHPSFSATARVVTTRGVQRLKDLAAHTDWIRSTEIVRRQVAIP